MTTVIHNIMDESNEEEPFSYLYKQMDVDLYGAGKIARYATPIDITAKTGVQLANIPKSNGLLDAQQLMYLASEEQEKFLPELRRMFLAGNFTKEKFTIISIRTIFRTIKRRCK